MKKKYFQILPMQFSQVKLIVWLAALFISTVSFSQTLFQKSYNNNGFERGTCVIKTNDGGYLEAGASGTGQYGPDKFYIVKTDYTGGVTWSKIYAGDVSDYLACVIQTTDGGYMLVGTTFSFNTSPYGDILVIKINATGAISWQKHYGYTGYDYAESVQQTADGGYIIGGLTSSFGAGYYDYFIMKIDSVGYGAWGTTIGGTGNDYAYAVLQTSDGGYMIGGQENSYSVTQFNPYNIMLCKLNAAGNVLWSKAYGGGLSAGNYICNAIRNTTDGGIIVCGWTDGTGEGMQDVFMMKTDSAGILQWSKTYGGANSDFGYDVQQTTNGGYAIAGTTKSFGAGNYDAYLITTDATGNLVWSVCYGDTAVDMANSLEQTADGGFIIAGETSATGSSNSDFYLIKCDASGSTGCYENDVLTIVTSPATDEATILPIVTSNLLWSNANAAVSSGCIATTLCLTVGLEETVNNAELFSLYPNPATDQISFSEVLDGAEVFTVFGEVVVSMNGMIRDISVSNLADGIYFIRSAGHVQRFVVQH
ncbi:MAG: T9SS type A sorting domain-containing protein [Bacteroidia bacterium]